MKKLLKFLGILVLVVVLAATGLIGYLTATEFNPDPVETVEVTAAAKNRSVKVGEMLKIVTFNTGYAGLDRTQDFFMDGGTESRAWSKERLNRNLNSIAVFQSGRDSGGADCSECAGIFFAGDGRGFYSHLRRE